MTILFNHFILRCGQAHFQGITNSPLEADCALFERGRPTTKAPDFFGTLPGVEEMLQRKT